MKTIHRGDLQITIENQNDFQFLTEVSGSVYVRQGATFTAPALTEVSGSVDVQEGATFTAPALTEVSGYVYVQEGATFTAPALTEVSGYVYVQEGATFTAPALTKSGYVDVRQGATFTAPALTEVSGSVDVRQGATFTAPALTVSKNEIVFEGKTLSLVYHDGITSAVVSEKQTKGITILTVIQNFKITDNKLIFENGFIAKKDNFTAHAKTAKQAISDLNFKIVAKKLKNNPITPDTELTVMYYRTVTGACDLGCRDFMDRNNIAYKIENKNTNDERTVELKPIKAKDLLPILEKSGAYGLEKFRSLLEF